jgi:hypothetical protein
MPPMVEHYAQQLFGSFIEAAQPSFVAGVPVYFTAVRWARDVAELPRPSTQHGLIGADSDEPIQSPVPV